VDLARRSEYYTPSYINETDVLRGATTIELSDRRWANVYCESDRDACFNAILDDRALREKVKLLEALGYKHPISRMTHRKTEEEVAEMEKQKEEAFAKLVQFGADGGQDLSRSREADVAYIAYGEYTIPEDVQGSVDGNPFFKNKVALTVLREFQGFDAVNNEIRLDGDDAGTVGCVGGNCCELLDGTRRPWRKASAEVSGIVHTQSAGGCGSRGTV